MEQVYLSRRNLLTLLSKLDRQKNGEQTHCTLIKTDTEHETYPCSAKIVVTAVEDKDYYTDRKPGSVLAADEPLIVMDQDIIAETLY
jgi:hypothetical protein